MDDTKDQKRVILLPVDGSEHSERAFNWYLNHLHKKGDHVGIVNVMEPAKVPASFMVMGPMVAPAEWHEQITEDINSSKKVLDGFKKRCEKEGIPCSVQMETSEYGAGQKICDIAKEKGASGIVMGSRGLNFIRRTLLGSVSSYVVNHADVPVVVTPPEETKET